MIKVRRVRKGDLAKMREVIESAFADFYEFAEALTLLREDAGLRARLGAQGRAYVRAEYAWSTVTTRLRETLERLVA